MQQQRASRIIERNRVERRYVCPHPCCRLRFNGKDDKTNITSVKRHFYKLHTCRPECAVIIEKYKNAPRWKYDWFNVEQDTMQLEFVSNEVPVNNEVPIESSQQGTNTVGRNRVIEVTQEEIELVSNPSNSENNNKCSTDAYFKYMRIGALKKIKRPYTEQESLAFKDALNISDKAYQRGINVGIINNVTSLNSVKTVRTNMNNSFSFEKKNKGAGRSIIAAIQEELEKMENLENGSILKVKYSMDGASVANDRNIKQVIAAIEFISEKTDMRDQRSPYNCVPIGISMCSEEYDSLKTEFDYVWKDLETLTKDDKDYEFVVKDKKVYIHLEVVLDIPLLMIVLGFSKAFYLGSKYCCWLCKGQKPDLTSFDSDSIAKGELFLRNIAELIAGTSEGQENIPLLKVPLSRIYICILHFIVSQVRMVLFRMGAEIDQDTNSAEGEEFIKQLSTIVGTKIMEKNYKGIYNSALFLTILNLLFRTRKRENNI